MVELMLEKIIAFFMAAYLFIAGIPYGNEPIKVEFELQSASQVMEVCEPGDYVSIGLILTTVGRPFKGKKHLCHSTDGFMYQVIDGETVALKSSGSPYHTADEPVTAIIKHWYTEQMLYGCIIDDDAVPGIYSLQVSYGGCTQVFENVLEVKAKD